VERRISTIGHGTRPVEEFIELLTQAGVRRLVDVRSFPGSRRHPQFGRDALEAELEAAGIDYAWRRDLGGFRKPRADSPHVALRNPGFRGYADYMEGPEFERALAWLTDTSHRTPTAIMCAETVWWRCHRRMISDALLVAGWDVIHVLGPGRPAAHTLHPAARVDAGRLMYDVGGQAELSV
jgi:uncharacterized protein (DUF488 family)